MFYKIGEIAHGGIVFHVNEDGKHGKVAALVDLKHSKLPEMDWGKATDAIKSTDIEGYTDWQFPSKEDLNKMYTNLHKEGLGEFQSRSMYWSATSMANDLAWRQDFMDGSQIPSPKIMRNSVRPFRVF